MVKQYVFMIGAFSYGAITGSFLNMLFYRLRMRLPILKPSRSFCDHCGKPLKIVDIIPFLPLLLYRRRSRCCNRLLSWTYPAVELATGLVFLGILSKVVSS